MHIKGGGGMRPEGREWEGQNSGEETLGDLWKGEGWDGNMGNRRWTLQGLSGRKAGNLKEVGLGGFGGSGMVTGSGKRLSTSAQYISLPGR